MLRETFFFKFFRYKRNSSQKIIKYNADKKFALQDQINVKIIEINQEIVDKKKLNKINLKNNDKIEIVHFIGGG